MRLLLIGGNGFIGRFVAAALQRQGHSIAVFHRGTSAVPAGVDEIRGDHNQLHASAQELKRFAADVVIDLVLSSGPQAEELMNVFRGATRRVVMLSSMDVYRAVGISQGTETGPLQEGPFTEESELRRTLHLYPPEVLQVMRKIFPWVTDDYDKIPAERIVMNDLELPGTVLRLPMVYGPGDPLHRFYPVVKRVADGRRHIIFPETLAAWRSPRGYVENVAAAIARAATDDRAARRIFNVCEDPSFSELEWARKIAAEMRWDGEFVVLPVDRTPRHLLKPGNAAQDWTASSARIRQELGYEEPVALDEAIRRTIAWQRENAPGVEFLAQFDYVVEDAAVAHNN
ncbi:MAG TPA: NAD-dependent epimerase/dehydratase family protein [Candidatus Sulfotelmatobacter sp.]|nr:NAD-dependent epimerase/dehydratase family protein [Candidatus Sulfotelmatobacter sp.]